MTRRLCSRLPFALLAMTLASPLRAEFILDVPTPTREVPVSGAAERHVPVDEARTQWGRADDDAAQGDKVELQKVLAKDVKTVKLQNVVPPIQFASGEAEIPADYIARLRQVLERMKDRTNVRLHFVGHTDDVPLRGALLAQYGDNLALSRERAGTTAEYFQQALNLPPESISYEGMGETQPVASNATAAGKARNRRVEVEVWYDEIGQKLVEKEVVIAEQFNRVKVCRVETVCKLRYKDGHGKRARIRNLVPPLHFDDETTRIPPAFIGQLSQALTNLRDKQNVTVKFVGHTDNLPLGGRVERIYGTHLGLSKARARRAALAVQDALRLPTAAIDVDGKGAALPIAGNDTDKGRAVNRRIEVEFWYDDPLQELPDEPQICPEAAGAETVTRVHEPSTGPLGPILFEQGQPVMPAGYAERLKAVMDEVAGKTHVRLRFVGYTDNARLDRRTAVLYGDDIGLSAARARRAMTAVQTQLALTDKQVESEGRGYVQSADVVNTGFIESDTARVEVQVVYDELAALDDDHLEITRLTREVTPKDPFALNLMRITVDGKPIDDPNKGLADVQRCTDVALDQAHMRFEFDNLGLKPRLNVSAWPTTIRYQDDAATDFADNLVRFRLHTNYAAAIAKAEVRVFDAGQSVRATPRAVIALGADGRGEWQPALDAPAAPGRELQYVLRVYDRDGRFDETAPQALWVVDALADDIAAHDVERELLVGYGETRLAVQNIPQRGGTIKIFGRGIPAGHGVWLAGRAVPVDGDGAFVAEEILPAGLHTVEVAVLDAVGNGELFLRDLELKKSDWFHVGIADVTASLNATNGPAQLVTQAEHARYDEDLSVDGRLAFYTTGKFGDGWQLTASADTLEGRIEEIFDNFLDKSPNALFRRLDPDYHYPTFGDDSTVEEDAPTLGKFYAKLKKDKSHAMWGNFKIGYADTTLAHVDRGLYGANVHYQSPATTGFGEPRLLVDAFGAEPGTLAGRDEFLGTGGSLYFLRHQDILVGSERVRIEVRDKDSGIVVAVKNLTPALDYDIDYLQGRLTLSAPLSATTADEMLVQSDGLSGNDAFLVVRYEFTPGFDDVDTVSTGGRAHVWFNDHVKFGVTSNNNDDDSADSSLQAADLTLRKNAQTWIKVEASETEGAFNETLVSGDGGFTFGQLLAPNVRAAGQRIDASLGFADVIDGARGQATVYTQSLEAGYSAPGLITDKDTEQFGGTLQTPLTDKLALKAKADTIDRDRGLSTRAGEVDLAYALDERWTLSSGVRHDQREDNSAVVPLTQVEGERTDLAARATYDSKGRWLAYGYVQETLAKTDTREDNGRVGSGGSYRVSDRFKLTGEASTGDLGEAVRLGTEYLYSDRTNLYLNYALENETSDNGVRAKKGSLISGAKTRYSDSASIYVEEKYSHGDVPTGLMHSTGVNLAPADRWTVGANLDVGTLRDPITAASMDRQAAGVTVGYGAQAVKWASALEYRVDETQNATDLSVTERETWLTKNSVKYQINPDWRFIGKLNHSESRSSQGEFYDGSYTEAVAGYAFRPVAHDRLNTLLKYTYFYNLPTAGQVTPTNATAEFIQKSHIFSLDTLYDLTTQWTLGFKYAYRLGQLAMDRVDPEFFDSRAHLYVVRADWHFRRHWDALVEARRLTLPDAQDQRDGALVALYRHVNDNVKLGAGYNFTDFSDDLTDLDYDHQGVFINVVGKW